MISPPGSPRRATQQNQQRARRGRRSFLPLANVSPDAEENIVPDGITEDLSRDFEPDDFAEAITDDLTTGLARISGLLIIARNTAVTYKGKAVDVRQVGRDLGVRFVLEGTLRRSGD